MMARASRRRSATGARALLPSPGSPGIGCGLGLAIVDEIAQVHGARFSIGSGAARPRRAHAGALRGLRQETT